MITSIIHENPYIKLELLKMKNSAEQLKYLKKNYCLELIKSNRNLVPNTFK